MREEAIQWAWSKGLIAGKEYHSQEPIEILSRGNWNATSPGPDFKFFFSFKVLLFVLSLHNFLYPAVRRQII